MQSHSAVSAVLVRRVTPLCLVAALALTTSGQSAQPRISFNPQGISISGVKSGEPLAWMMLVRQPGPVTMRTRIVRGIGPAKPNAAVAIRLEDADSTAVLLALASVDSGAGVVQGSERLPLSLDPIRVQAAAGQASIAVESPFVELLYVRSRGGAWSWHGADGSPADADGKADGWITISLTALKPYRGNPHPPASVEEGDQLLLIDPDHLRAATVEVGR
jgi:hypothetical protein